jgi:hypothetical protein
LGVAAPRQAGSVSRPDSLVGSCLMWEDLDVDDHDQRELRDWAERLVAATEAERRAMGRAILMLLAQIEVLQGELVAHSNQAMPDPPTAPDRSTKTSAGAGLTGEHGDEEALDRGPDVVKAPSGVAEAGEETARIGLRDRARSLAGHLRTERRS